MMSAARCLEELGDEEPLPDTDPVVLELMGPEGERLVWNPQTKYYEDVRTPAEVVEDEVDRREAFRERSDSYLIFLLWQ